MIAISLTHFVDFVCKSGTPKLTVVQNAKKQVEAGYDPATDFYKLLRERIIEMHTEGQPKSVLDTLTAALADKKKQTAYPEIVKGYKTFLGKKKIMWFPPPKDDWTHGGLSVSVNPEVGLEINGTRYAIKLYFKADKLSKLRADIITHLMQLVLASGKKPSVFAVLDVRRPKLFAAPSPTTGLTALLQGEAASFAAIYSTI